MTTKEHGNFLFVSGFLYGLSVGIGVYTLGVLYVMGYL